MKMLHFLMILSLAVGSALAECVLPDVSNVIGDPIHSSYPTWSRVTFSCEEGYSYSGPLYSYCEDSGSWNPRTDEIRCLAQCKGPDITQDVVHFPLGSNPEATQTLYNDEEVIQYACAEGELASLVGPNEATCINGVWEPSSVPTCNHCGTPLVSDPEIIQLSPKQPRYATYDKVRLSCPDDVMYTAKGTNVTFCEANGEWIPDPTKMTCHENCLIPARDSYVQSRPLRDTVDVAKTIFKFNDVIANSCSEGKMLVGPTVQRCANGKWLPDRDVMCM